MNKYKTVVRFFLFVITITPIVLLAQDRVIAHSDIPSDIQTYIQTHFSQHTIVKAKIDAEGFKKEYEIKLDNNVELEFNHKYKIKKIKGKSALPKSVIPLKINDYVSLNYPNNFIVNWEMERKYQEVKLDNGLELEFSLKNDFIRIDK